MLLYQAPLEGLTTYIYRNALKETFGYVDKYFAPFISPYEKRIVTEKEINQLIPSHNEGINLVPQILTNDVKGFGELTHWLYENYGYDEFNLNFGCPSGTVVSKGRGSGALKDLDALKDFLDRITENFPYKLSIKTRLGVLDTGEFEEILELYNQYELTELIIHPRVRAEFYNGLPHYDVYKWAVEHSKNPIVYNGNIYKVSDLSKVAYFQAGNGTDSGAPSYVNQADHKITLAVMLGRPMIANPGLFREIRGGKAASQDELLTFLTNIGDNYQKTFGNDTNVLHRLKEIWVYMGPYLLERTGVDEKVLKNLMKSKRLSEYKIYMKEILRGLD